MSHVGSRRSLGAWKVEYSKIKNMGSQELDNSKAREFEGAQEIEYLKLECMGYSGSHVLRSPRRVIRPRTYEIQESLGATWVGGLRELEVQRLQKIFFTATITSDLLPIIYSDNWINFII